MDVSSFVLLSNEQALRRQLDIVANNMANTNTAGYKREQALFHEYVETTKDAPIDDARQTSYVLDYGAIHDTTQGTFQLTGNRLDVMIEGAGYLNVQTPQGDIGYTRAGFIKILNTGELATSTGQRLLDAQGQPIVVPPEMQAQVTITDNGSVMAGDVQLGRLAITTFADERGLELRGDTLIAGTGGEILEPSQVQIKTGGVEASNVDTIRETTNMIEILRSYQTSQRMSSDLADLRQRAIGRLSKIS